MCLIIKCSKEYTVLLSDTFTDLNTLTVIFIGSCFTTEFLRSDVTGPGNDGRVAEKNQRFFEKRGREDVKNF